MKFSLIFLVALVGLASIAASPLSSADNLAGVFEESSDYFEEVENQLVIESRSSDINADLQEFVNLLPQSKIKSIAAKHYLFDREFKKAYKYICSEEFYKLIRKLHQIPAYNEWLQALNDVGIDTQGVIASVHKAIGYKDVLMSDYREVYERTVASFIAEVKAVLPISEIKALYKKKLETSESFARLVELISSKQFQDITNALFADPNFVDFLHKLQSHNVDLHAVSDFFLTVFGITTPPGVIDD